MDGSPSTLRARLGRLVARVYPQVEDRAFNRERDRSTPESRTPRGGLTPPVFRERAPHVVVVPQEGPQFESWRPGTRNFYYEAFRSGTENFGDLTMSVLDVAPGEPRSSWIPRLRDHLGEQRATHIVTHIEHDPGDQESWHWDEAWAQISPGWDGVLLGVMFDSAFSLVRMKARRVARMSPNFLAVDICDSMDSVLLPGRREVGPVTMPLSRESLELVRARIARVPVTSDVSFIGVLYPYRVDLIERLRAEGIDVAVNPHRADGAADPTSSRRDQPGWLDYMAGLAGSRMTLNFSRFSAGDAEQYKTRVIEATVAGTLLLTDDRNSTRHFFTPEAEYGYFSSIEELPGTIRTWLSEPELLDRVRRAGQIRGVELAPRDFWERIRKGLQARGLPAVPMI